MSITPATSRAAVLFERGKPLEIRDVPIPRELEPGAILVHNSVATICGTDVHVWEGSLGADRPLPTVLGHEMIGEVAVLGPGVTCNSMGQKLCVGTASPGIRGSAASAISASSNANQRYA